METKAIKFLDQKGIKYILKKHKNEALTCELAAKERNCKISQIVKTMVAKDEEGNYYVCLIPGNRILKIKKVRKEAGGIKIDLMDPSLIKHELGLVVGAISPLDFPQNIQFRFYLDPTVLAEKYVDISSGSPFAGIEMLSNDLIRTLNGKVCDIISSH